MLGRKKNKAVDSRLMPDPELNPEVLRPESERPKTLYDILSVSPEATPEEIEAAYRAAAKKTHPDQNQDDPEAAEKFALVHKAGQVLRDPVKRARYNASDFRDEQEVPDEEWKKKLVSLFFQVEQTLIGDGVSYKHKNLIGLLKNTITHMNKQLEDNIRETEKYLKIQREVQERIKPPEGSSNWFAALIEGEVRRMHHDILRYKMEIEDNNKMLEEVERYKYTYEEPPTPRPRDTPSRVGNFHVQLGSIFGETK